MLEAASQDGLEASIQLSVQFVPPAAGSALVEEVALLIVSFPTFVICQDASIALTAAQAAAAGFAMVRLGLFQFHVITAFRGTSVAH